MRQLILYIATSLDGYIARKDGSLDWLPPPDQEGYEEFISTIDVILMGRKTYEAIKAMGEWPYTQEVIVFTSHPGRHDEKARFTSDDPQTVLSHLRTHKGKNIWLEGGGELIKAFHEKGLIDEYIIAVVPVTIGDGIPLFVKSDATVGLHLSGVKPYKDFLELRYVRA